MKKLEKIMTIYPRMLEGKFLLICDPSAKIGIVSNDTNDKIKTRMTKSGLEVKYEFTGAERTIEVLA